MNVFNCNQCPETFTRKWNLEVHQKRKHQSSSSKENTNKLNPISVDSTSSVCEVTNNGAYGGQTYPTHMVNSLTQPTPMYNHIQTQTFGDQKTTYRDAGIQTQPEQRDIYADSMVSENGSDSSITDSESDTSSVVSYEEMNMKSLLGKLEKVLNVLAHLFQEYKIRKHEWVKLIRKLGESNKMSTSERKKFIELVDKAMAFDREVQDYNIDQVQESKEQDIETDNEHGASCWGSFLDNLEDGIEGFSDARDIYENCIREWKIENDESSESENEMDNNIQAKKPSEIV